MKRIVVLMGMPGAGKDTQVDLLEHTLGYAIIRVGERLREIAKHDPKIEHEMQSGDLAEASTTDDIVRKGIHAGQTERIVCDGYPRSLAQAKALENICKSENAQIEMVIYLEISEEESKLRLKLRARTDDTQDAILTRLQVFTKDTLPVLAYYRERKLLTTVSGEGGIDVVEKRVAKALGL